MPVPPTFPVYHQRFIASTNGWLPEEVGAYWRLLLAQFEQEGLPADPRRLQAIAGVLDAEQWESIWGRLSDKFRRSDDGKLRNPMMERVREEQTAYREKKAKAGRAGAAARWHSHSNATDGANGDANSKQDDKSMASDLHSPISGSPSPAPREAETARARAEGTPPKKSSAAKGQVPIPEVLLSTLPDFPDLWTQRLASAKERRRKPPKGGQEQQLKRLADAVEGGERSADDLRQLLMLAIEYGWQGLQWSFLDDRRAESTRGGGGDGGAPVRRKASAFSRVMHGEEMSEEARQQTREYMKRVREHYKES